MSYLRTYFSNEKSKTTIKSGAGRQDVYKSNWLRYNSMIFLHDSNIYGKSATSLVS